MGRFKLGLKPPNRGSVKLRLADYLDHQAILPTVPQDFGHAALVSNWGMLGNDEVGDCAIAGPYHVEMLWNAEAGRPFSVSTQTTLSTYSAITGYDPSQTDSDGSNPTDQGSDMTEVAQYWQSTGFPDDGGKVHKIAAFLALEPGNVDQLAVAAYVFGAVGIGVNLPESAQEQFSAGQPWSPTNSPIEGGHFVPIVGRQGGNFQAVTWGALEPVEPAFCEEYDSLALAYLSTEFLNALGESPEGLNLAALRADLAAIGSL